MAAKNHPGEALAELAKKGPRPVYAIDGDERTLVDEAVRAIRDASLTAAKDFNYDVFSARDTPPIRFVEAAQTMPAFAKRRVVLVTQAEKIDPEAAEPLLAYLSNPNPHSVLILVADKLDGRTKLYKAFEMAGAALRFDRPKLGDMTEIVRARAARIGVAIAPDAVRALVDAVGADAGGAWHALDLLALYVGPGSGRGITKADVETVVSSTKEESIFELVDAIGGGDRAAVLEGLHRMLTVSRDAPLRVLAMVARHYRNLLRARAVLDGAGSTRELPQILGVPPFVANNLADQARKHGVTALAAGVVACGETDRDLKGGPLDDVRAMERLALRLMP
jgi:DNA polymerase-3 subunit delta